jgi:hypothetical protein
VRQNWSHKKGKRLKFNISLTSARNSAVNNSKKWLLYDAKVLYNASLFLDRPLVLITVSLLEGNVFRMVLCLHAPDSIGETGPTVEVMVDVNENDSVS